MLIAARESAYQIVSDTRHVLGEGPVWDERRGSLLWTSILDGEIHCLPMADGKPLHGLKKVWRFPGEPVASFGLCRSGRLVIALRETVVLFEPETGRIAPLARVSHADPAMRLNDGKVGPDGAFWVGSMDGRPEKDPIGVLYRVDAGGGVEAVCGGLKVSNGLAWSPDGRTLYHSDSSGIWVDAWDFDPAGGRASGRRRFVDLDDAVGRPDGAACDVEGAYWSAGTSAGCMNRFLPDGRLVERIAVPVHRPTMPCFGGSDMKTMFITSHSLRMTQAERERFALSGSVISIRLDVGGFPGDRFAD